MDSIGEQAMKTSWTFAVAAVACVVCAFPAFASQAAPKTAAQEKTARQLKAAATTKFVTDRQAANVQKVVDGADSRVKDEPIAYPDSGQAATVQGTDPSAQLQTQAPGEQQTAPQQKPPQAEAAKPQYRFMGTACGGGDDVAMFDNGGATPVFMRVGDKLVDGTEIVEIDRGCVGLLQSKPADKKGGQPTQNRYYLYNW
jgi:hypothetical protein